MRAILVRDAEVVRTLAMDPGVPKQYYKLPIMEVERLWKP